MMKKILTISLIVSAAILVSGIIQNNAIAYPQQKQGYSHDDKMMKPGSYAFGTIASLQNDENGNPTWIVSGLYKASLSMNNKTQDGAATGSLPNATVDSKFNMSMPNNSTTVFNGTATITMRQGPVPDVPVSIRAMENNAVSIWVEPTKIQNHFGNTPIFGTIEKLLEVAK